MVKRRKQEVQYEEDKDEIGPETDDEKGEETDASNSPEPKIPRRRISHARSDTWSSPPDVPEF